MVSYEFEQAMAVERTAEDVFTATLDPRFTIHEGPINGGITMALATTALRGRLTSGQGHDDPLCVSGFYLSAAVPGPAKLRTEVLRAGRTMSTGQASLTQVDSRGREVERIRVLATFGDLDAEGEHVATSATPPDMPGLDDCLTAEDLPRPLLEETQLLERAEIRMDPATSGWLEGVPSGLGRLRAWFRMRDGFQPTPLLLIAAVDALPPVAYDLGISGWVPTLELTVHVRARPAPGWLRISLSSSNLAGGLIEEDAEIWDSSDRLVAQARQLARVSRMPPAAQPQVGAAVAAQPPVGAALAAGA